MSKETKYDKIVAIINADYLNEDDKMRKIADVIHE